ncbi:MAG: VOC family protein [Saprospiraceae bacterium]|nr:VOC family protein [Saprospiraceae bacterium]
MEIDQLTFDHYSIAVKDLDKSCRFYAEILGLNKINRPDFDFEGAWFSIGEYHSLHLISDENTEVQFSGTRQLHFAFAVKDILNFRTYLLSKNIEIVKDIKSRPDGMLQLFIRDPDGYFVEITSL